MFKPVWLGLAPTQDKDEAVAAVSGLLQGPALLDSAERIGQNTPVGSARAAGAVMTKETLPRYALQALPMAGASLRNRRS